MLKKGDMAIVKEIDRNNVHPAGERVEIVIVGDPAIDPRPYYAKSEEGNTCYWYNESELEKIKK